MSVVDGLTAANFTDPQNQRIIYLAVGGLLLLAVVVAIGTVVWWRSTKAEHPALAPLEVMSTRKFEKSDYTDRKRVLDEVRPGGHAGDPDDDAVSDVVDLEAAAEAPLPDPAELADPDRPLAPEGGEAVTEPESESETETAADASADVEPSEDVATEAAAAETVTDPAETVDDVTVAADLPAEVPAEVSADEPALPVVATE